MGGRLFLKVTNLKEEKPICWIFDDDEQDGAALVSCLGESVLSDHRIELFPSFEEALPELDRREILNAPSVVFFDAFKASGGPHNNEDDKGFREYSHFMQWILSRDPEKKPKRVIFVSRDLPCSQSCCTKALWMGHTDPESLYAVDRAEIEFARRIILDRKDAHAMYQAIIRQDDFCSDGFRKFDFIRFVNEKTGSSIPFRRDALAAFLLEKELLSFEEAVTYCEDGILDSSRALRLFAERTGPAFSDGGHRGITLDAAKMHQNERAEFLEMRGPSCMGFAAFSWEEVDALRNEGQPAVLFLKKFDSDCFQKIERLAGLVVLDDKAAGHLALYAQGHDVTTLVGVERIRGSLSARFVRDKETVFFESISPAFKKNSLYCHLNVGPLWENPLRIKPGEVVTLATGAYAGLYRGMLTMSSDERLKTGRLVCDVYRKAAREIGFRPILFKANIDSVRQIPHAFAFHADGIGLVRTEHLLFGDKTAKEALQSILLTPEKGKTAHETLKAYHIRSFTDIFDTLSRFTNDLTSSIYPVRVRLLDALPEEFIDEADLPPRENALPRGVEMGLTKGLYKNQIEALFQTYAAALAGGKGRGVLLDVMAPMIRTLDELLPVKEMVFGAADRYGVSGKDFRFGMMMETKEAACSASLFAPHVDFVSIGSNDLTSEILGFSRGDLKERRRIIEENHGRDPFVTIHDRVRDAVLFFARDMRNVRPDMSIDLCGAHASDMDSLRALHPVGLNSVSMAPCGRNHAGVAADLALYDAAQRLRRVFKTSPH